MSQLRVGLLPLYLELYDKALPHMRQRIDRFYSDIADVLQRRGLKVEMVKTCRLKSEFKAALAKFEKAKVDALVTLHLAYSPSLESSDALAATGLPIIVLDTTPTFDYGPGQDPNELLYNHGIHGVQDMCNLLIRNGKRFEIVAGHWRESDVLDRVVALVDAARLARAMRTARVGTIGQQFKGMGDFAVPLSVMKRTIGIETVPYRREKMKRLVAAVSEKEIAAETSADRKSFRLGKISAEGHRCTTRACLAVRRWIEQEQLTAFTVNFLEAGSASGLPVVPFLEASKAMARGVGYAGEGDVLTAALVGALASVYPDTSFTEMFCPDWKGNRIFLSHMGEVNPRTVAGKAMLVEHGYSFTDTPVPVRAVGGFRGGRAVFVNLAPLPANRYRLIVAPVDMGRIAGRNRMADSVHGWFTPAMPVPDFLEQYSRLGGTHHAALVYGNVAPVLTAFGRWMGWESVVV